MKHFSLFLLVSILGIYNFSILANANDTAAMGTASNIQFIQNKQVIIHKEDLVIGPLLEQKVPVSVKYVMENTGSKAEKVQMAFPLPGCSFQEYVKAIVFARVSRAETCIKEPEMKINVDGKSVTDGVWTTVLSINGASFDQTAESKQFKVNTEDLLGVFKKMPEVPDMKKEKEEDLFKKQLGQLCGAFGGVLENGYDCKAFNKIHAQRTFIWNNTFEPKKQISVEHHYSVESSYNLDANREFNNDVFCLKDQSVLKAWKKYRLSNSDKNRQSFIGYILKTGANWAAPIEEFNLTLKKHSPKQYVSTCFDGLKKTNSLDFQARRKNYTPKEDLYVLFFSVDEPFKK